MINFENFKQNLFPQYLTETSFAVQNLEHLQDAEISTKNFDFYTSVSSVYSSKIEGEEIDLDSYIKHKNFGIQYEPDYTKKIDDLYAAYQFAKNQSLTKENLLEAHKILSKNILSEKQRGIFRTSNMFVLTDDGKIEYVAAAPNDVESEMQNFFMFLENFRLKKSTIHESFFNASFLHLLFVKIHPMNDGNGRLARLLEKWFLAEKLGEKAWFLETEKMYYQNHQLYYQNLRKLGLEYEDLDFKNGLDFFKMLPLSLK